MRIEVKREELFGKNIHTGWQCEWRYGIKPTVLGAEAILVILNIPVMSQKSDSTASNEGK